MDILSWFRKRGPAFILERANSLVDNYRITPGKAQQRIDQAMQCLESHLCFPTFFVPGIVVKQHTQYIHSLQDRGAEIGVHGYNHIDLNACDPENAAQQLAQAAHLFTETGLDVFGFRAPYLSCSDALLEALPEQLFNYSSNRAVQWDSSTDLANHSKGDLYSRINLFYHPQTANSTRCLPFFQSGLVEIPVSVPDDLQMKDGLGYDQEDLAQFWLDVLKKTYAHGEIYNLMFHPELAAFCVRPFSTLLQAARNLSPRVWVARLGEVAAWWRYKSSLCAQIVQENSDSIIIDLPESTQATWLVRNLDLPNCIEWSGNYRRLTALKYHIPAIPRPLVGIDRLVPIDLIEKLSNQGYLLDLTKTAKSCSIFLDNIVLRGLSTESQVVDLIENSAGPLIRMWPWPSGYRSALCISGDLDALSLMDYLNRLRFA
jgi:peptidoglycan/xylan/chitin deacetylase (PgdA/CDA1 family)